MKTWRYQSELAIMIVMSVYDFAAAHVTQHSTHAIIAVYPVATQDIDSTLDEKQRTEKHHCTQTWLMRVTGASEISQSNGFHDEV